MRKKIVVTAMLTLALALCGRTALGVTLGATPPETAGARGVDLDVRKTVHPGAVEVGELQTFAVKVTNDGVRRAEGVRMTDPLPSKVRFVRASTSRHVPGSCDLDDRVLACRLGDLRPDRTVTVKIGVRPVVAGSYTNRAVASHANPSALGTGVPDASDASDAARSEVDAAGK
jgi:uncharacterized repeat protein (TIGR01451 family)